MGSTRLPGKVLLPLAGEPVLRHHIERLRWSGLPICIATTFEPTDLAICSFADQLGVPVFKGSEQDVLNRFYECAERSAFDVIVRVTSDCPLIDGKLIARAVGEYLSWDSPDIYYSNCIQRTFPRGFDFEIFSFEALKEANERASTESEREHVTPYINRNISGRTDLRHFLYSRDASHFRLTLDTPEDLSLLRLLFEENGCASMEAAEIISLMEQRPDLALLNQHIEQKKH